jgi:hypothetical protein
MTLSRSICSSLEVSASKGLQRVPAVTIPNGPRPWSSTGTVLIALDFINSHTESILSWAAGQHLGGHDLATAQVQLDPWQELMRSTTSVLLITPTS